MTGWVGVCVCVCVSLCVCVFVCVCYVDDKLELGGLYTACLVHALWQGDHCIVVVMEVFWGCSMILCSVPLPSDTVCEY